jgi:hypothetical protein
MASMAPPSNPSGRVLSGPQQPSWGLRRRASGQDLAEDVENPEITADLPRKPVCSNEPVGVTPFDTPCGEADSHA